MQRLSDKKRRELTAAIISTPAPALRTGRRNLREIQAYAVRHYNMRHAKEAGFTPITTDVPSAFLDRITVNYLRHVRTTYDARVDYLYGKEGRRLAQSVLRGKILDLIAKTYPELQSECERQRAATSYFASGPDTKKSLDTGDSTDGK